MLNFDSRSLLIAILVLIFSLVDYYILRDMMYGILLGSRKKKSADKIISEQPFFKKFTQSFIADHIDKYQDTFAKWSKIKLFQFIFCLVQLVAFGLLIFLNLVEFWVIAIICGVIAVYDIVLFSIMMSHTASSTLKKSSKGSPWTFEQ